MVDKKKELSLKTLLICENAFFAEDKKLNIIGVFDSIFVKKLPVAYPFMALAGVFEGPPNNKYSLFLKVFHESEKKPVSQKQINLSTSEAGRANIVIRIPNFPIKKNGKYHFSVYRANESMGDISLEVKRVSKGEQGRSKKELLN